MLRRSFGRLFEPQPTDAFRLHTSASLKNCSGAVLPIYGLALFVLLLTMGGAIDFARWFHARQHTLAAMDAAVLAGGRVLQLDSGATQEAVATAERYYSENVEGRLNLLSDTVGFAVSDDGLSFSATGNAEIATLLLGLANIPKLPLLDANGSEYPTSEISAEGQAEFNIEISMMLDVTGSMSGSKLSDMQVAAKDLIDIVVWEDQSEFTSRVALVPFSQSVNVGSTYFNAITNENTDSTLVKYEGLWPSIRTAVAEFSRQLSPVTPAHAAGGPTYDPCVVDRAGSAALTDAAPGGGTYLGVYDIEKYDNSWTQYQSCKPSSVTIEPLTSDKDALKNKIDSFVASGYTAGHIGTAFTWYTLSPKWSNIWPAESAPAAYSDSSTKKIAILLTDGVYNTWYNGNSNGNASAQAKAICTNMKNEGVTVYTIGFDLQSGSTAADVMTNCATDPGKSYMAEDGTELKQAFRNIALSISTVYLSR